MSKRWPVHVSMEALSQIKLYAAARQITVTAAADRLVSIGMHHVAAAARRHRTRVTARKKEASA